MDVLNPGSKRYLFPHSGTFSANPICMVAGLATMQKFDRPAIERLNALARRAITGIQDSIIATGIAASVTGAGSMLRVHLKPSAPRNYREAYLSPEENQRLKLLLEHMADEGFLLINSGSVALSTPMTEADIDALVAAFRRCFMKLVSLA